MPPLSGVFIDKKGDRRCITELLGERSGQESGSANTSTNIFNQPFGNATFSGEINAIDVKLDENVTIVSFWGNANQNATRSAGQDFVILTPLEYNLLGRFVEQVDQFAIGYNAATNDFKYTPIRITGDRGMEIVTAPNISIGTRFTFQFVFILAQIQA